MRETGRRLGISHSTISRYRSGYYKKRVINIIKRYEMFLKYLYKKYDRRCCSIQVCIVLFKRYHRFERCPSMQQVYNWIQECKIALDRDDLCYKKRGKSKNRNPFMAHLKWNIDNKTVLPFSLRPKKMDLRDELGHLEIDSIIGKRNENKALISVVDRASRMLWLIKADYTYAHYTSTLIRKFIEENNIICKSITTDNGKEFETMGITAKRLGVKLYKCDPYCSFQRGSNERMNAIVRRFIKKGESLKLKPQTYLNDISHQINSMPRKLFNFKSAFEMQMSMF